MKEQKRVVIYISEETHRKLKSKLALMGETVSGWFRKQVKELLINNGFLQEDEEVEVK